jgi:ComF family protein
MCDKPCLDGLTHPICIKPLGLDGLISVYRYNGIVKQLIKEIKYRFLYDLAETLTAHVPAETYSFLSKNTPVYPLPLHFERLRWRGFNQAEKLAVYIEKNFGFPMVNNLLVRTTKRTPQADIDRKEDRIENAKGLFQTAPNISISSYPNIILFDDVWTTGATMKEAAKVLKRAGVKKIWGLTIAR